jgi:hypothetical protein
MGLCREIRQYTIYSDSQIIAEPKKTDVIWVNLECRETKVYAGDWRNYFL